MRGSIVRAAFVCALLAFSCGKKQAEPDAPYCRVLDADGTASSELTVPAAGSKTEFKVETSGMWQVGVNADWLAVAPSRGNMYGSFTLTVYSNTGSSARSATLTVSGTGVDPVTLTVTQEAGSGAAKTSDFRFMTFNIRTGGKADGSSDAVGHEWATVRKTAVFAMFADIRPDIAVLQECRQEQLNDLEPALTDYAFYRYACDGVLKTGAVSSCTSNVFKNNGARSVIMLRKDRFEMRDWGVFWLSETPDVPSAGFGTETLKACLWLKVRDFSTGLESYVVNIHFITPGKGDVLLPCANVTVAQIKSIIGDVTESGKSASSATVFLAGDFNAIDTDVRIAPVPEYMNYARLDAERTDASFTYNAYSSQDKWKRLDHIFYLNAKPLVYKVVNENKYGTEFISDHFPVYCDFEQK